MPVSPKPGTTFSQTLLSKGLTSPLGRNLRNGYLESKSTLIDVYSSKTGRWKVSELVAAELFLICSTVPFTSTSIGGTFLWICIGAHDGCRLLVYDPDRANHRAQLISLPLFSRTARTPTLCESTDGFLQCAMDSDDLPLHSC
ncbi:hypothetical protein ACH5RR_038362 [Cinchona calisaya]|uniref:F-box protein n=1 Tax=Cinchona calisaya TaxID=153742 RepID=A0ABD2XYH8_9GENT